MSSKITDWSPSKKQAKENSVDKNNDPIQQFSNLVFKAVNSHSWALDDSTLRCRFDVIKLLNFLIIEFRVYTFEHRNKAFNVLWPTYSRRFKLGLAYMYLFFMQILATKLAHRLWRCTMSTPTQWSFYMKQLNKQVQINNKHSQSAITLIKSSGLNIRLQ